MDKLMVKSATCIGCHRTLPISAFYLNNNAPSLHSYRCKACIYPSGTIKLDRTTEERVCPICHKPFRAVNWNQKYCSANCRQQIVSCPNVTYYKKCNTCGDWFYAKSRKHSFCGGECSKRVHILNGQSLSSAFQR